MSIIFTPKSIKRCGLYNILGELEKERMGFYDIIYMAEDNCIDGRAVIGAASWFSRVPGKYSLK
jgi:hypothetical protein